MITLSNQQLTLQLLDPAEDLARCGSRYCVGGYIWQVVHPEKGPLLTGPVYPDPEPNTFDGQGAPDMFVTALGADRAEVGDEVGVIGVGRVRRTSPIEPFDVRFNREVIEFLPWDVTVDGTSCTMEAEGAFQEWRYRLLRHVRLNGPTVESRTEIRNTGAVPLPVKWFAHPFFPLTEDRRHCRFSMPVTLPETPGYTLDDDGTICQNPDFDWGIGCYQALDFHAGEPPIVIEECHDLVGSVVTEIDFRPAFLPVWSNANTFSFEPYFEAQLGQSEGAAWRIHYRFGL